MTDAGLAQFVLGVSNEQRMGDPYGDGRGVMGGQQAGGFEHLAEIIAGVEDQSRVGVCIDTCHNYFSRSRIPHSWRASFRR
ncbi:MAG TPA: hypothetical protein ENK26_00665 [Gammaproteobacteria bacterium]|nr:hypothetical protein [Gammaproteobacteria bacterium]